MVQYVLALWITSLAVVNCMPAGVFVTKDGEVGASFGGYSASAGLGGILSGDSAKGGLHAEAGTPDGYFAGAGLGGNTGGSGTGGGLYSIAGKPGAGAGASISSSSSSASSSSSSSSTGVTNNIHPVKKGTFYDDIFNIPQSVLKSVNELLNARGKGTVRAGAVKEVEHNGSASSSSAVSSHGNTKYDEIFAIPQSVLGAVNQFLNRNFSG